MTHRLRSQYTLGPSGRGTFRHRFNYASGRWVTFRGLRAPPQRDDVRGWMVRTDFAPAAAFESSHESLNEIYRVTLWTLENVSLGGYLVDCPQRERMGYGGDGHATTTTALLNYHTGALFTKWAMDWRDGADHGSSLGLGESATGRVPEPGNLPYTAPTYWGGGGPAWSGYCVHLPWEVYRHLGDRRILHENLRTIANWLEFLESKSSDDLLRRWGGEWEFLGDWLWPGARGVNGDTRETLFFNNCYWIYNLVTAAKIAGLVGQPEQALEWDRRAMAVRRAVHREFFHPADASYVNGLQAYLAIALLVEVPPPELRPAVWQRLEQEIREVRGGHIHAGITGGAFLFKTLMEARRDDLLYTMVSQEEYPGWIHLLRQGATTIPEDWEGEQSQLHSSYLYVGAWFIHGILGIQPGADTGFSAFDVHPAPLDEPGLTWARGHYESMHGRIEVDWRREAGQFQLTVTVPPNTAARVHLPPAEPEHIREGGRPLAEVAQVEPLGRQDGRVVVRVPSGRYVFTVPLGKGVKP
jgi:alpha-L-rhamnosidase